MSKFKVGDEVIVIEESDSVAKEYLKRTGTVREITSGADYVHVKFPNGDSAVFFDDELEYVTVYISPLYQALK